MRNHVLTSFAAFGCLIVFATSVQAQTALIDWSDATPATNPDSNGNFWNTLGAFGAGNDLASTSLIFSDNSASPWSVAVDNPGTSTGFGGSGIAGPAGPAPFDQTFATTDGIFNNNTLLSTITFTGLQADTTYDFTAIGGRASSGVDGVIDTTVGTGPLALTLANDGTLLDFSILSDNTGSIAFTFADSGGAGTGNATFNALSVQEQIVPEPGSMAVWGLIGLVAGGYLCIRRRRQG